MANQVIFADQVLIPNLDIYKVFKGNVETKGGFGPGRVFASIVADIGASYSNAKIKIAIVTTNPKTLKLAEHYKNAIRDVLPVEIFSTMVQAREWVKLMDGHLNLPKSFSRSKYW